MFWGCVLVSRDVVLAEEARQLYGEVSKKF